MPPGTNIQMIPTPVLFLSGEATPAGDVYVDADGQTYTDSEGNAYAPTP